MKKKIFGGILAVAIAAVAAVNVNINNEAEDALSALSLANVEALAQDESGDGVKIKTVIDKGITEDCINGIYYQFAEYETDCIGTGSIACSPGTEIFETVLGTCG